MLGMLGIVMTAPLFALAAYLWLLSRRVAHSGRFPPPGATLIKDTPIVNGEAAKQRARLARTVAGLLIAGGLVLGSMLWRLADLLAAL